MTDETQRVTQFEIDSDTLHGAESGFLRIRRVHLRNIRADGSRSRPYVCDFVTRPKGPDAVVVALWRRGASGVVEVLLRRGLRPALSLGRPPGEPPIADTGEYPYLLEVVAGIIEREDVGEQGVRNRAAIEIAEESGFRVAPSEVDFLGAGVFPSPGSMPEKFWFTVAQVSEQTTTEPPQGDGSPMEQGSSIVWMSLDDAIDACVGGVIEDAKTELCLRRLRDRLHADPSKRSPPQ